MSEYDNDPGEYRGLAGTTEEGLAGSDSVTIGSDEGEVARCESCGRLAGMPSEPCRDCPDAGPSPLWRPVPRELAAHRRAFGAPIRGGDDEHHDHEIPDSIRRYLVAGEEHASVSPLHPVAMGATDLVLVGALAAAVALHVLLYLHGWAYVPVVRLIWCLFAIAAGYWAWQLAAFRSTWIVVTPKRIMTVVRFPTTKVTSLPWRRARDVELSQTVLGRTLGYGTLQLLSIGTDHALAQIQYVPRAEQFYRLIWGILQPVNGKSPMPEDAW